MKTLDPGLAAHLGGTVTTLATCWILTRRDGAALGLTDHDQPLVVAGLSCDPVTGVGSSEQVASADLSVGGGEVLGALSSAAIDEADILAGRYDGALLETYLVNWANPGQSLRQRSAVLGEITRRDGAFVAEVRSLSQQLDQPQGRIYQHRCDADLGDGRCGVDLTSARFRVTGSVLTAVGPSSLVVTGLDAYADDWFSRGRLLVTSGANAGFAVEVRQHVRGTDGVALSLWQAPAKNWQAGDQFSVTAGCDKLIETCTGRFANAVNFRGFPHIPGSDYLVAHPALSALPNDGGALVS